MFFCVVEIVKISVSTPKNAARVRDLIGDGHVINVTNGIFRASHPRANVNNRSKIRF